MAGGAVFCCRCRSVRIDHRKHRLQQACTLSREAKGSASRLKALRKGSMSCCHWATWPNGESPKSIQRVFKLDAAVLASSRCSEHGGGGIHEFQPQPPESQSQGLHPSEDSDEPAVAEETRLGGRELPCCSLSSDDPTWSQCERAAQDLCELQQDGLTVSWPRISAGPRRRLRCKTTVAEAGFPPAGPGGVAAPCAAAAQTAAPESNTSSVGLDSSSAHMHVGPNLRLKNSGIFETVDPVTEKLWRKASCGSAASHSAGEEEVLALADLAQLQRNGAAVRWPHG